MEKEVVPELSCGQGLGRPATDGGWWGEKSDPGQEGFEFLQGTSHTGTVGYRR